MRDHANYYEINSYFESTKWMLLWLNKVSYVALFSEVKEKTFYWSWNNCLISLMISRIMISGINVTDAFNFRQNKYQLIQASIILASIQYPCLRHNSNGF